MIYCVITGELKARTAIHIGSGEGAELTDALIRRDAVGNPIIPGTAIAGALRSWLTRLAPRFKAEAKVCRALLNDDIEKKKSCACAVCRLFGDVNPSDEAGASSEASRLLVFNAKLSEGRRTFIRDGVGIQRITGAAARAGAVKFDLEVLPAETIFDLRMELRGASLEDEQLLAAALAEWRAGRAWLGGRVARGLGAFQLTQITFAQRNLNESSQLMAFLQTDKPWQKAEEESGWIDTRLEQARGRLTEPYKTDLPIAYGWISFEGTLQAQGPLLTNDTMHAGISGFDHAPLLLQIGDWRHPILTGAGLRGVLRAHAERIVRTLATLNARDRNNFLQICPACDPTARRPRRDTPAAELPALESCDSLLLYEVQKDGNQLVKPEELCLACRLFGSSRLGSRLFVEDASFAADASVTYKMLDFLAVDRFTGGGAENLKFDALALWRPAFTLRLHLDNPMPWELGWLTLTLRDLAEGWLAVGYGAAKGFGRVKLKNWKVRFGYLSESDKPSLTPLPKTTPEGIYTFVEVDSSQAKVGLDLAEAWIADFHAKLEGKAGEAGFSRDKKMALKNDEYFRQVSGKWVNNLYPKEVKLP